MRDVALVTSSKFPELSSDDQLMLAALFKRGLSAAPAVWDNPKVDWANFKLCVLRSTWDYHLRLDEFLAWAERVDGLTSLWNPVKTVRWNTHKSYLRDLEARGVPIVPTVWLEASEQGDLASLMAAKGWQRVVIKPVVSASAHETILVSRAELREGQAHIARLLPTTGLMIQPFMASVVDYGERSLMFVDGELTHAVRRPAVLRGIATKHANPMVTPADNEIALAWQVLRAARQEYLYARVDIVRDDANLPRLMELELVEPSLFFAQAPEAAERLANAIARLCGTIEGR